MRIFNEPLSNQSTSGGLAIGHSLSDVFIIILPPVASKLLLIWFQLKCRNENFFFSIYNDVFAKTKKTASQASAISFFVFYYVDKKLLNIKIMWCCFFIVTEGMFI